jgi:hypothetical protein
VDVIWTPDPDSQLFADPVIRAKATFFPVAVGIDPILSKLDPGLLNSSAFEKKSMSFVGSIEVFNFYRVFWFLYLNRMPDKFDFKISSVGNDGLSVEDSMEKYLARLFSTSYCLNFTRRSNGYRSPTGRIFDVLAAGRLLIQERCDEAHCYIVPGEHFVEFETVYELIELAERVQGDTPALMRIAEAGQKFWVDRYGDYALTRHLSTFL